MNVVVTTTVVTSIRMYFEYCSSLDGYGYCYGYCYYYLYSAGKGSRRTLYTGHHDASSSPHMNVRSAASRRHTAADRSSSSDTIDLDRSDDYDEMKKYVRDVVYKQQQQQHE